MSDEKTAMFERQIALWSGIEAPNEVARMMAAQLSAVIESFEALRGTIVFEDEPSSFEAALAATKDRE